jgi:hypothetical protein
MLGRLQLLLRAGLRLSSVGWHLRSGFGATERWLLGRRSVPLQTHEHAAGAARAAHLAWAVANAARWSPWRPSCLARSLALWSLLRDAGLASQVRVGARQGAAGLLAHAWVEIDGNALSDDADPAGRFPPLQPTTGVDRRGPGAADTPVLLSRPVDPGSLGRGQFPSAAWTRARTSGRSAKRRG